MYRVRALLLFNLFLATILQSTGIIRLMQVSSQTDYYNPSSCHVLAPRLIIITITINNAIAVSDIEATFKELRNYISNVLRANRVVFQYISLVDHFA